MLEFEIAAIYYFIASVIKAQPYFEEVPQDMLTPCVFYPTPNTDGDGFSLSSYSTDFVIYLKFIDATTSGACIMANDVLQAVMKNRRKILLVDENGKYIGKNFKIKNAIAKKIDNGVYQMEISWTRYARYNTEAVTLAKEFFFNGNPVAE